MSGGLQAPAVNETEGETNNKQTRKCYLLTIAIAKIKHGGKIETGDKLGVAY